MARIKQLSKHLINQIAAGEVIERPASVVKELVENSIDAKSTKISIDISNECKNIRVADNGSGIHPDDIMLAFSNHATSKIKEDNDLFNIHTLGFRGEALASIISISKLICTSRTKDFNHGFKIECENSEVKKSITGCAIGTIMEVQNLFYNIPARLKFLKSEKTEFAYIQELVQSIAIAHPEVAIELKNNGKQVLKTTGLNDLKSTIKEIYSKDTVDNLKEVYKTDDKEGIKITGLVSTPNYTRASKKSYHIYINSRTVKCPVFLKSVDMAYKNLIAGARHPFVVLNLEIPPQDIDVNVHPTKKEVRYKNPNLIFSFIYSAITNSLSTIERTETPQKNISFMEFAQQKQNFTPTTYITDTDEPIINPVQIQPKTEATNYVFEQKKEPIYTPTDFKQNKIANYTQNTVEFEEQIIGQYKKTYILIEKENGLEIVDQHIAHERYLYEQLKSKKQTNSQILFISDVLTVSPSEALFIKENKTKFENVGYEIEVINDTEVIFKKVPQMISKVNQKEILSNILSGDCENLEEKILITTSCKSAIKANQPLSMWQMQEIIKNWRTCEMPYTCPHGRTISKTIPHKELAGFFQRQE